MKEHKETLAAHCVAEDQDVTRAAHTTPGNEVRRTESNSGEYEESANND